MQRMNCRLIWFVAVVGLAGCGKGIDATLATGSEASYRESLNKAWKDMTVDQQNAYNWAVSDMSLGDLMGRYSNPKPRDVITREADNYIKQKSELVAKLATEFAKDAPKLEEQDRISKEVLSELAKITVTSASLKNDGFGINRELVFIAKNDSRYGISQAEWTASLFLDGNQEASASCPVVAFYSTSGGLDSGKAMSYSRRLGFDCRGWDTVEVQRAKSKKIVMKIRPESVTDFGGRGLLPKFDVTKDDYEAALKKAKGEIQTAQQAKDVIK